MKNENLMIGIDTKNCFVKVMNIVGFDLTTATVEYFPFDQELFVSSNYAAMVDSALTAYFTNRPLRQSVAAYIVLPNSIVGNDLITVPTMKKAIVQDTILAQMRDLYRNFNELKINTFLISATKTNQCFQAVMVQKHIISELYKTLATHKLYVKNCSYAASTALNTAFKYYPSAKKRSFVLMDIRADITTLTVCFSGVTAGFSSLPFGYNILKSTTVLREATLYEHNVAYLAVQNASERAKQTKLSMAVDPDAIASEVIDESAIRANTLNSDIVDETISETPSAPPAEEIDEDDTALPAEKIDAEQIIKKPVTTAPKAFVHKFKRLPAYMQRPIPETQEGIEYENFRIFIKKALLTKMFGDNNSVMPNIEFILVNIPNEYAHVIAKANEEGDSGAEFIQLELPESGRAALADNLDLYGALFMDLYNKKHNF